MARGPRKVLASGLSTDVFPIGEQRSTQLGKPSKEALELFPFYWRLPVASPVKLLKWKIYVRKRCLHDLAFREAILEICAIDVAFFAATFCSVFEPRPPRMIPLSPWIDQVDWLAWLEECYGVRDIGGEKSRGIGVSWLSALFFYNKMRFDPGAKLGMMSKDESTLDGPDENSLMGKVWYLHAKMPAWFRYNEAGKDVIKRNTAEHIMLCTDSEATLQGFVPTSEKVRGLRFTALLHDEFAFLPRKVQELMNSAVHTTHNRIFISTWHGADNTFHEIMRLEPSTMLRIEMYWWNNTERWKGCYTTENGRLKVIDTEYAFPPDYPFILDGLKRSPWVDYELRRPGSTKESALEELYGLQGGDARKLFRLDATAIAQSTTKHPQQIGEIWAERDGYKFNASPNGRVKVWGVSTHGINAAIGDGQFGPFSAGCDLAFGTGSTNSTLEVINIPTGEQVLEVADSKVPPVEFAEMVVDVLRWVNGKKGDGHTKLVFENNGQQGNLFGSEAQRLGYGNIHRSKYKNKASLDDRASYLGVRNTDRGLFALGELDRAIISGECVVRSEELQQEINLFCKDTNDGKPIFPKHSLGNGDRAQAMGLAWYQARKFYSVREQAKTPGAPSSRDRNRRECEGKQNKARSWEDSWSLNRKKVAL